MKLVFKDDGEVVATCDNISILSICELLEIKDSVEKERGKPVDMNIEN